MSFRTLYEYMLTAQRERGRSRNYKGESISSQQLQTAQEDYDEEATLFVFRLKSLKQGQSRSLLTQAARHHAAQVFPSLYFSQLLYILTLHSLVWSESWFGFLLFLAWKQLNFFRKGLKSLEAVEPHVKLVTEHQHIDYQFSGLEDDDAEEGDDDDGDDANDDGELSFDYGQNDHGQDVVSTSRNSMEVKIKAKEQRKKKNFGIGSLELVWHHFVGTFLHSRGKFWDCIWLHFLNHSRRIFLRVNHSVRMKI